MGHNAERYRPVGEMSPGASEGIVNGRGGRADETPINEVR